MSDANNGSPVPGSGPSQEIQQATPANHHKRNRRKPPHATHVDGSVSDSVANHMASPRAKQTNKPRKTSAAVPGQSGNIPSKGAQNARPVAGGGGDGMTPATPFREDAYAGARFQASPAASSLPKPKFFAKVAGIPKPVGEASLSRELVDASSPETSAASPHPPPRPQQNSPGLDLLFSAHRAEKDRNRANGAHLSPELATRTPPATEPRNVSQISGKNAFFRELDGDDSDAPGPQSLPSQHHYMHQQRPAAGFGSRSPQQNSEHEAYTKSLKDLLFNQAQSTPPPASAPAQHRQQPSQGYNSDFEGVFGVPSPGPSTPGVAPPPPPDQQDNYSWKYGNRNLSPLFKASRNDNGYPRPPSQLRQDDSTPRPGDPQNFNAAERENNGFFHAYPQHHAQSPQPTYPSHQPNGYFPQAPTGPQTNGHVSAASQGATPGAKGPPPSRDVRSMEDDIKRMLNLNPLSSN